MANAPARAGRAYLLTVACLVFVLALIVFVNSWGVFTADIKPEIYLAPKAMLDDYSSAWTFSPYLGGPNFNTGLAPIAAVLAALRGLGLSPEIAFKVFHLILWIVAAWGMVRLVRRLEPRIGPLVSLTAGIVFVANPYAVSAGATLAILLPMALLPWQLLCLTHAIERPRSWRWPALFGLTFFLMSGANAGVVPVLSLLAVVPLSIYCRYWFATTWRRVVGAVAKCALFVVWVSAYWLVPTLFATGTGSLIVENSESLKAIANVSSFSEVLRGLGLWPLYGSGGGGPWVPAHSMYLTSTVVVLATFLASALAILAFAYVPGRLSRLLMSLVCLAAVIMVGLYPVGSPSQFGHFLNWLFESVPALSAFRTTNKIGAVLFVAFALVAALALHHVLGGRQHPSGKGKLLLTGCSLLAILISLPAWTGKLYTSEVAIPSYWKGAANFIDKGPPSERVLALPGQVQPQYRWSQARPDDIFNSLFSRDVFVPITTPSTSKPAFNFGAALDDSFQSGVAAPNTTSTFARYLGVGSLLLRHDMNWENYGGARPSQTQITANGDNGLSPIGNFGNPGENVGSPTIPPDGFAETAVPPLQLYGVTGARPMVRAESKVDSIVVVGDGWSVPAMARTGDLVGSPAFRYLQDLTAGDLAKSLGAGHRIVLTDTNRRRDSISNRLTNGQGPLLPADEALPSTSRTLGDNSDDQTVLRVVGGAVKASQSGYAFYDTPWGVPENAFDNDPQTSWIFGDFKNGTGQTLTATFDSARPLGVITISQAPLGTVRIGKVTVSAGGVDQQAAFDANGVATMDFGDAETTDVRIKIDDLVGAGFNAVGISDVLIDGFNVTRVARVPNTLNNRYTSLPESSKSEFAKTPLDVLLTRIQGTPAANDDEEANLERDFAIPDDRVFRATANLRLDVDREDVYDRLSGTPLGATSSELYFDNPDLRASQAFDGVEATGWVPVNPATQSWIELDGPKRSLPDMTFEQRELVGAKSTNWATRITVIADGKELTTSRVSPGRNTIDLTKDGVAPTVKKIRIVIDESVRSGGTDSSPPKIVEIGVGRLLAPKTSLKKCVDVAEIDGVPLLMRPVTKASATGSAWQSCGGDLSLEPGQHFLRTTDPTITVDSLDLADTQKVNAPTPTSVAGPAVDVKRGFGAAMTAYVAANPSGFAYYLVIGQGYDSRWRAVANGKDLGKPVLLDGYSTAWLIDSASAQTIDIQFGPQRSTDWALLISMCGLIAVGLVTAFPFARRRLRWLHRLSLRLANRRGRIFRRVRSLIPWPSIAPIRGSGLRAAMRVPVRARAVAGWGLFAAGCWFFASWPGLVAVVAVALWHLVSKPGDKLLIKAGAGLILIAGIVFVVGMGDQRGTLSAGLVSDNSWPNLATVCGLVFALVGVWRSGRTSADGERHSARD